MHSSRMRTACSSTVLYCTVLYCNRSPPPSPGQRPPPPEKRSPIIEPMVPGLPYFRFRFRFLGWGLHCSHCRKVSHNLFVVLKVVNIGCGYGFTVFVCRPKEEQNKYMIYGTGINTDSQIGYHEYPHRSGEIFSYPLWAPIQIRWEIPLAHRVPTQISLK